MKPYQIITDSCCDFTGELYAQMDLTVVPLTVIYQGTAYQDSHNEACLKKLYDGLPTRFVLSEPDVYEGI